MAESSTPYLSIVVPTYRGARGLTALIDRILVATSGFITEIILVDDGSPQIEQEQIRELAAAVPAVTALCLPENRGQQGASFIGLAAARGEVVVTLDDDGSHPPAVIPHMVAALGDVDLVYGVPRGAAGGGVRRPLRRLGTALNNLLFTVWLGKPIGVPVTSFRAIDARLLKRALALPVSFPYLSAMLFSCGARSAAVWYDLAADTGEEWERGGSRYSVGRLMSIFLKLVLYWGPLRRLGRRIRPPQPLELAGGCR